MKAVLLVISLIVAIAYSHLLLAQNSDSIIADVDELEAQEQQTKEAQAKALKEGKAASSPKQEPSSQKKKPSSPTKEKTRSADATSKNKVSSKVFIPTEEISEDKPVAFPVDI